jgi:ABC-type dipeptide/oligopeptide/nickel transport system permease subunit
MAVSNDIPRWPGFLRLRLDRLTLSLMLLATILAAGLLAPVLTPRDPNAVDMLHRMVPPVWMEGAAGPMFSEPTRSGAICCPAITLAFQIAGDALRDRMDELNNG